MESGQQLWTIIGVALIVAIIASVVTANITGNVIIVRSSEIGTQVYTKVEIDNKFSNIIANSCNVDNICEINKIISTDIKGSIAYTCVNGDGLIYRSLGPV